MEWTPERHNSEGSLSRTQIIRVLGGVVSFSVCLVVGFFVVRSVVRYVYQEKPNTEAHEGFGEAMVAFDSFVLGMGIWLILSVGVAVWVGRRLSGSSADSSSARASESRRD